MQYEAQVSDADITHLRRAIEQALQAEAEGNCAVGSVITLNGERIAEAGNRIFVPEYNPVWHAEMTALSKVPVEFRPRAREMTCYTTLEPCIMCTGTLLMHGFGRVVFGSTDTVGGSTAILPHLPDLYEGGPGVPEWVGPCLAEECDPLREFALERFARMLASPDNL